MAGRLALIVAALGAALGFAGHARAAVTYTAELKTAHFHILYTGDPTYAGPATQVQAGEVGAWAEQALTTYEAWGFPAPPGDDAGLIDIYIDSIVAENPLLVGVTGIAWPVGLGPQAPGAIEIDALAGRTQHVVSHEVFHIVQFGTHLRSDRWLDEATAEWASWRLQGFPAEVASLPFAPDRALDCAGDECGLNGYDRGGYTGWRYFELLSERYGPEVVRDVLANQADDGLIALQSALGARGATISDSFIDFSVTTLAGTLKISSLLGLAPTTVAAVTGGTVSGALPDTVVAVNHLASRFVMITRGDPTLDGPCYAATLALTVTSPAALNARPFYFWSGGGGTATPFSVNGSTATLTVPWDTCQWPSAAAGYVSLANPSTDRDGQNFVLKGTLTVDKSKIASAGAPPVPGPQWGQVVPATTGDPPPTISLFGPEVFKLSAGDTALRVIVWSNGPGSLRASLSGTDLGTVTLRAGNNDVRLRLSKAALLAVRRLSAVAKLKLTPVGSDGTVGKPLTRRVVGARAQRH